MGGGGGLLVLLITDKLRQGMHPSATTKFILYNTRSQSSVKDVLVDFLGVSNVAGHPVKKKVINTLIIEQSLTMHHYYFFVPH